MSHAMLSGAGVSRGIVIGSVHHLHSQNQEIPNYQISTAHLTSEQERYAQAVQATKQNLADVKTHLPAGTPPEIAEFIDAHLLMLDDEALTDAVSQEIAEKGINAEQALENQRRALVAIFDEVTDPYLRTRRDDIEHVINRVQQNLLNSQAATLPDSPSKKYNHIVVAEDIAPADMITLHQSGLAGFVTECGGALSHTAILARSLGIPGIVGVKGACQIFTQGTQLIIDGAKGDITLDPTAEETKQYENRQQADAAANKRLEKLIGRPAISVDNQRIRLYANIELNPEIETAVHYGAEGVGLYRTEFLFMNRPTWPTEEEQYDAYHQVVAAMPNRPVTIRTLDLGADKQVSANRTIGHTANNPALGLRAIRLCLKERPQFKSQLRALLRASAAGNMQILIPMISNLGEIDAVLHMLEEIKDELRSASIPFDEKVKIGCMIEVPAAAMIADLIAPKVDFFSIGTNDLIQYTLAIDRIDEEVNYLYDPLHPAVLRMIQRTIAEGQKANIPVTLCGEMASDPRYTRLLLGLGLSDFSMHPASLLEVKDIIHRSNIYTIKARVKDALRQHDSSQMAALVAELNEL